MKQFIYFIVTFLLSQTIKAQNDSLRKLVQNHPLVHIVDSISHDFEKNNKSTELILSHFGRTKYSAVIIWKDGTKYCGMSLREHNKGFKTTNFSKHKIKKILSSRLFADSCNLCELLNGEKEADIDHGYIMYLMRNHFKCNEIYFTSMAYLYFDKESCVYDIRLINNLKKNN